MIKRVDAETTEFEECTTLLQAMRAVHGRMLKDMLIDLSSDRVRDEVAEMQASMGTSILNLGAKKAFLALCERLRDLLATGAAAQRRDPRDARGSFGRLNAEFGFSLAHGKPLDFDRFTSELQLIESNYVQYLGLTLALRLAQPKFMEQFRRMLISKLRVVFENASSELELWNKAVSAQVDSQLRERRKAFKRRRETLEKIQSAAGELELRIDEIETQDQRLLQFQRTHQRARRGAARPRVGGAVRHRRRARQARPSALRRRRSGGDEDASSARLDASARLPRAEPRVPGFAAHSSPGSASTAATACPGRDARSLPRLALGGDAAADAGRDRARLLRALPRPLPRRARPRRGQPDDVLALWSGLGYYGRARNLHRGAAAGRRRARRRVPAHSDALAALPGIGRSTAAAIAAFSFGERVAILDGNVKRVLARVLAFAGDLAEAGAERELWSWRRALLPASDIEAYTQGLMDLGATICVARAPRCLLCPVRGVSAPRRRPGRRSAIR